MSRSGYLLFLFDLDGTLTDPGVGITRSVQYALAGCGVHAEPEDLLPFIGPPLHESFRHFYSFDEMQARRAVELYREYYAVKGIFENAVYPGIPSLLKRLNDAAKTVVLATSKPTFYAKKVLRHFRLESRFTLVAGSNMDGSRAAKADVIAHILAQLPAYSRRETVMIGDRKFDIAGARAHGIDSAAVAYGYGSLEELRQAGPTRLVHTVEELSALLESKC